MNKKKIQLNPKQTVLVIGGKGFIGKHVVEQIENYGAYANKAASYLHCPSTPAPTRVEHRQSVSIKRPGWEHGHRSSAHSAQTTSAMP